MATNVTVNEFLAKINALTSKKKKSDYIFSLDEINRKNIFEGLTTNQRTAVMNTITVRAQNKLFTAANVDVIALSKTA